MLVTRLVPCPRCLAAHNEHEENMKKQRLLQGLYSVMLRHFMALSALSSWIIMIQLAFCHD